MSILLCQPIFAPNDNVAERDINSLISLGKYLKENNIKNVDVCLGGWALNAELWENIISTIKEYFGKIDVLRFSDNVGKAVVVNTLVKKYCKPHHQYIISVDSDILFSMDNKQIFNRLINMAEKTEQVKNKKFGLIGLQQLGHGCHLPMCYENEHNYTTTNNGETFTEKFVWHSSPSGIAGGCLFISRKAWDDVGGYRIMGVYVGDDAYFLIDVRNKGYSWQMSDSIPIIHPPENDIEYAKWKVKVCQRDGAGVVLGDISNQIKEATKFWEDRNVK